MASLTFKTIILTIALFIVAAQGASLTSVLNSLEDDDVRRCGTGCNKNLMKTVFNYLIGACRNTVCVPADFTIRTNPLGSLSYIQQYCVVSESFHSADWSMRIQADLVPQGAYMVLVAVPRSSRTELEKFKRPYVKSQLIPRTQLHIINQMVKAYCGVTV